MIFKQLNSSFSHPKALAKSLFHKGWNSGTVMLWASQLSRITQVVLILPFAILRFSPPELAVWLIFEILCNLHNSIDLGFTPVFSRAVAIASTGAKELGRRSSKPQTVAKKSPNLELLGRIVSSMSTIYLRLTAVVLPIFAVVGSLLLIKPIGSLAHPVLGWTGWAIIVGVVGITLLGKSHVAYLQGMDKIALINRYRVVTTLGASAGAIIAVALGGGLLAVVITTQVGLLIFVLVLWYIRHQHQLKLSIRITSKVLDSEVFGYVWPATWRSGLGRLFGFMVIQVSGIIYAQLLPPASASSYLLAFRLIYAIRQLSIAPFFSKIPLLNQLRATSQYERLVAVAGSRMFIAYVVFAFGVLIVGLASPSLMEIARKDVQFPPGGFWALLGIAGFVERYGAMHIQLYSTTNHIIWHIANSVTGILFISLCLLLYGTIGAYAFPVAMLLANMGFYSWYAAKHSYAAFNLRFWRFERRTAIVPFITLLVYCILMICCI